ncbi:hypothetical protein N7454_008482 [Penicillium verhagenii]|nr:hypothetical protein N7454_008482 [Penicillium verhagenii]
MGLKMAEFDPLPVYEFFPLKPDLAPRVSPFVPYWARSHVQCAQNLLPSSSEPIEYDHDDEDFQDNCFFFPEDCSYTPPKHWAVDPPRHPLKNTEYQVGLINLAAHSATDDMLPELPDIKMLDSEALGDLLEDNLLSSQPTAQFSPMLPPLPSRQLRNLSATYGAAYTCYAKNASSGNLTGVNPASHPSSYVTAQSMSLGDVGSIVFELDDSVAVVTRLADKVLLAAIGPNKIDQTTLNGAESDSLAEGGASADPSAVNGATSDGSQLEGQRTPSAAPPSPNPPTRNGTIDAQHEIDRSADLARLASLNLSASPSVLLALESKCAALGRFLGQKLHDLESPEDF